MEAENCRECQRQTQTILDYASGDSICTECGLVMESHIIDERPEWRVFEGDDAADKIRVGAPAIDNPLLLHDNALHTRIDKAPTSILRAQAQVSGSSTRTKRLAHAFKEIRRIAEYLNLMPSIQNRACEIFKDAEDVFKGRHKEASYAACLEMASQQEGAVRWSIKGIAQFCQMRVSDIHKAKLRLLQHLQEKSPTTSSVENEENAASPVRNGTATSKAVTPPPQEQANAAPAQQRSAADISTVVQIERLMRRFCASINMDVKAMRAATEITKAVQDNLDIRRSPISIAAACMHIAAVLCDPKISLQDVARAANISEDTIRKTYRDLHPHLDRIIPAWLKNGGAFGGAAGRVHYSQYTLS